MTIDGTNRFGTQKLNHTVTDLDTYSFANSFKPQSQNFQLDNSFSFKYGRKYDVGEDNTLSFFFVGSYDAKYNYLEGNIKITNSSNSFKVKPSKLILFIIYIYYYFFPR